MTNPVQLKTGLVTTGAVTTQTLNVALTSLVTAGHSVIVMFSYTGGATASITSVTDNLSNLYTQKQSLSRAGFSNNTAI